MKLYRFEWILKRFIRMYKRKQRENVNKKWREHVPTCEIVDQAIEMDHQRMKITNHVHWQKNSHHEQNIIHTMRLDVESRQADGLTSWFSNFSQCQMILVLTSQYMLSVNLSLSRSLSIFLCVCFSIVWRKMLKLIEHEIVWSRLLLCVFSCCIFSFCFLYCLHFSSIRSLCLALLHKYQKVRQNMLKRSTSIFHLSAGG